MQSDDDRRGFGVGIIVLCLLVAASGAQNGWLLGAGLDAMAVGFCLYRWG